MKAISTNINIFLDRFINFEMGMIKVNKAMLLILCMLVVIVISGCATDQGGGSTYDYEGSSGGHAGRHH